MHYLARTADRRTDVRHVLPSARSVIVLGTNYHTAPPYSIDVTDAGEALVARYAWGDDYHDVIGKRLDALIAWMRQASSVPIDAKGYVDTGPIQERVFAQRAGIGWIGKNTCVINPGLGSWIFLSEILCSLDLDADEAAFDRCGTCTRCLNACPTGALVEPRVLDSTRCLSYLTIELRGPIPDSLAAAIGSHVYGCDICQEVCPWNHAPPVSADPAWRRRPVFDHAGIRDLAAMSDDDLRAAVKGSAMKRAKIAGLRRNLDVALTNLEHDASSDAPIREKQEGRRPRR
jgi:epoxyqueuosine reductase